MHGRVNRRKGIQNLNMGSEVIMRKAIVNIMHGQESEMMEYVFMMKDRLKFMPGSI